MGFIEDNVEQVTPDELLEIFKKDDRKEILIDVREPDEYIAGHIPGVPLIPMHQIPARMAELDKDENIIFICRSGSRSHHVVKFLQENGFTKVKNYYGGMLQWEGPISYGDEK